MTEVLHSEIWSWVCDLFPCDKPFTTIEAYRALRSSGVIGGDGTPYCKEYQKVRIALAELEASTPDLQVHWKGHFIAWVLPSNPVTE